MYSSMEPKQWNFVFESLTRGNDAKLEPRNPLPAPLLIPEEAKNIKVALLFGTVWHTVRNVDTGVNDTLTVEIPNELKAYASYVITVPGGQYSLGSLSVAINRGLAEFNFPVGTLTLGGDDASQRITFQSTVAGTRVKFGARSMKDLLGQPLGQTIELTRANYEYFCSDTARINAINSYIFRCNLAQPGLLVGGRLDNYLFMKPITVSPNYQQSIEVSRPMFVDAQWLAGQEITYVDAQLLDENRAAVNTREKWNFSLEIRWDQPIRPV